jgi:dimethylargininase
MLTAITHSPSPALDSCQITFVSRQEIDNKLTASQHQSYRDMLTRCGVRVVNFDRNISLADSVFVEDVALVLDELGIIMPMGTESRRAETAFIAASLKRYRNIELIELPAKLEGGDILRVGRELFVGLSSRSSREGAQALQKIVAPYGYTVTGVKVTGCLHLKTGVTALDDETVLINPLWVDSAPFARMKRYTVPSQEPFAANILSIDKTICIHSGFKRTREMIEKNGYHLESTDISEFQKAEAGLTCMSLIFTTDCQAVCQENHRE